MKKIIITESQFNRIIMKEAIGNNFNTDELNSITSFNGRLRYCVENFGNYIGKGSARAVFQINDNAVLKLAINEKGIAQNGVESDNYLTENYTDIFPKLYYEDDDDRYLITEFVIAANSSDFKKYVGIDFKTYINYICTINNEYSRYQDYRGNMEWDEIERMSDENEWLYSVKTYMENYQIPCGDMIRLGHYGMVNRDGSPRIVIIDYGLNDDILYKYYKKHV